MGTGRRDRGKGEKERMEFLTSQSGVVAPAFNV